MDDPRLFGQIAAANALSDVYAMRARPILALALVAFPTTVLPAEVLEEILRGGAEKVAEAGAVIGGGHSIDHDVPLYGLAVTGLAEESRVTRNSGARPGDSLVLTKPLGIGVTVCAGRADTLAEEGVTGLFRRRLLSDGEMEEAVATMTALNRPAVDAMEDFEIHAATDVTGYGLLGHLHEMMTASGTTGRRGRGARFRFFPPRGGWPAAASRPTGAGSTSATSSRGRTPTPASPRRTCSCSATRQTSGGLLVALPAEQAEAYAARCRGIGAPAAAVVGRVRPVADANARILRVQRSGREQA